MNLSDNIYLFMRFFTHFKESKDPTTVIQKLTREFGRAKTEQLFAEIAYFYQKDGRITASDRYYLHQYPLQEQVVANPDGFLNYLSQIHPAHLHNLIQALQEIPADLPEGWIKTDDLQYLKKTGDHTFTLVEARSFGEGRYLVCSGTVSVAGCFNGEVLASKIRSYYPDVETFKESYPDPEDQEQILAEILFEETESAFLESFETTEALVEDQLVRKVLVFSLLEKDPVQHTEPAFGKLLDQAEAIQNFTEKLGENFFDAIMEEDNSTYDMAKGILDAFRECKTEREFTIADHMLMGACGYSFQTLIERIQELDDCGHVWESC